MSHAHAVAMTEPEPEPVPRREPPIPSGVLGMLIFIVTEVMFFAGLVSAYMIAEGMAVGGWPPPDQPRLPIEMSAANTVVLISSGVVLFFAGRAFRRENEAARAKRLLLVSIVLGATFVVVQGVEWVQLISQGLTLSFSTHGAFFYVIVGTHAAHAIAAIIALVWAHRRLERGELKKSQLATAAVFWYFVVGVWPVLYNLVYL